MDVVNTTKNVKFKANIVKRNFGTKIQSNKT